MHGLDDAIAGLGDGGIVLTLAVAFLLGLRHATDPDHVTAVSTLVLSEEPGGSHRAGRLGLAWGAGHATTLLALGLPVVLLSAHLPEAVERGAELAVAGVIVVLAVRLLVRWRRGSFHVHEHSHGELRHAHPHMHEHAADEHHGHPAAHHHAHEEAIGRSPRAAYAIGLVHGIGGSAGVGILLVGGAGHGAGAVMALTLFATATALSMAAVSAAWGWALARGPVLRRMEALVPVLGAFGLLFGVWYGLGAVQVG